MWKPRRNLLMTS
ncbi:hypothetical protein Nmel_005589, partial [Mimus melanotis]